MHAGLAQEPNASGEEGKEEEGEQSGKEERGDVLSKPQCQSRGTKS